MNDQANNPKNSTTLTPVGDGIDTYNSRVEGDEGPPSRGLIRGDRVKFTNAAEWENAASGDVLPGDLKLIVTDVARAMAKWGKVPNAPPEETRVVPPGEPFPNTADMNDAIPREEWRPGINGPQGPWQKQHLVYLIDPRSMNEFTFVTSTLGGDIAVEQLVRKIKTMRRYRGPVSPIVTLGDVLMKTRFGDRRRPHFDITADWVSLGGGGEPQQPVLPAPADGAAVIEGKAEPAPAAPDKADRHARRRDAGEAGQRRRGDG
jgi:hypothetical protein